MDPCDFVNFISLLACEIAKEKTPEEVGILSAFFTQLGSSLATLALFKDN